MGLNDAWYFDAWSVRDGMAFASHRRPAVRSAARRCVYLAVPGLEPEAVPGPSAGLWAARSNFQPGFFDEEGIEIGLPDLKAVREAVRRGYLAGGIGPGPGGEGVEPEPPDRDDDGPGNAATRYLEDQLEQLRGTRAHYRGSSDLANPHERAEFIREMSSSGWVDVLFAHMKAFAEATLVAWVSELPKHGDDEQTFGELFEWTALLYRTGLWSSPVAFDTALRAAGADAFLNLPWPYWPMHVYVIKSDVAPRMPSLLFRVPCPLRTPWDKRIRKLSDKLLLATSTLDYFRYNADLPELIPALLAALAVTTSARFTPVANGRINRPARVKAAFEWLAAQLPIVALPATAERQLTDFAWRQLDRR
jgi:hypothetical protein